jgi:hypothetical protein
MSDIGHSPSYNRAFRTRSAEEQTARAISAYAQYACLLSLKMGSTN